MAFPLPLEQQIACILQSKHQQILKMPRREQRRVFYFFATQDIARILRKVKDYFLAISRRCLVAMAPCQR